MRRVVFGVALAACGRIGYEPATDGSLQFDPDDGDDDCPSDTAPIADNADVCIELVERGNATWTAAKADCESIGRQLCSDLEWATGCDNVGTLVDMIDTWEWVAEETGGIAGKRGDRACSAISTHVITDPYDYRCCEDR